MKKRIIVKIEDAREKLYAPRSFFDSMNFGVDPAEGVYFKDYYGTREGQNLIERHSRALKSIPIDYCCMIIKRSRRIK